MEGGEEGRGTREVGACVFGFLGCGWDEMLLGQSGTLGPFFLC